MDSPSIRREAADAQEIDSLRSSVAARDAEIARLKAARDLPKRLPDGSNDDGGPMDALLSAIWSFKRKDLDGWELELVRRRLASHPPETHPEKERS
jgi:hypothetical protein